MSEEERALPPGWAWATVGEVLVDVRNGISTKPDAAEGLPILRISAVRPGRLDLLDVRYLPDDRGTLGEYDLRENDLLFTRYNGNRSLVGACARVGEVRSRTVYPDKLIRARVDDRLVDSAFLAQVVNHGSTRAFIESKAKTAAGQVGISGSDLRLAPVPLAPLSEQRRIVAKLNDLLARSRRAKEALAEVPALLERYRQSVLAAAFRGELTADWRAERAEEATGSSAGSLWQKRPLESVCQSDRVITYGVVKLGDETQGGIPCLRTSNVRWLRIDCDGLKRIQTSVSEQYSRTVLRGGEVLVNVRGTLGGVAVVASDMVGWNISREVAVVPVDAKVVDPKFLMYWIGSEKSQRWLQRAEKGVAYTGINIEDLRLLPVTFPSLEEQAVVVTRIEAAFARVSDVEGMHDDAIARLPLVERMLLTRAFRGELVPQDPADEPASVLLDRLRAERATADAPRKKAGRPAKRGR